jgi:hypothetical protein
MVEVYKTNVQYRETAEMIVSELVEAFPGSIINFDLDDCDKILRVESEADIFSEAAEIMKTKGFVCEALE